MRNILYFDEEGYVTGGDLTGVTKLTSALWSKYNLPILDIPMPNLVHSERLAADNSYITEVHTNLSKLQQAREAFRGCYTLKHVEHGFPSLVEADSMFHSCALPAEEIDKILESLPSYTDGPDKHRIGFTGCPGCATCHPEIGRNKGWNVVL
ncbi:MAG: hypothetical protein RR182_00675 [Alistipes sp.]